MIMCARAMVCPAHYQLHTKRHYMAHEEQKAVIAAKSINLSYFIHNAYHHFVFSPSQIDNNMQIATLALLVSGAVQKSIGCDYTLLPDELSAMLEGLKEAEKGRHIDKMTITAGCEDNIVDLQIYAQEVFVSSVS